VQPEADALAALYAVRRTALLLLPVLFAAAVLLAWGSAASVVRPLNLLTRAAEAIAGGNLEAPVPPAGTDEAGRLGRALDDMRIALKRSIEEIEAANAQLERGVAERTHELNRLYDELRAHDRLRGELLKKAISAQEDERKRVARELHDETSQMVNALLMELDAALARYPSEFTRAHLAETRVLAARLLDGIHRLILDLRPSILDDLGLFSAIEWFARQHLAPHGIAVRFEASGGEVRLPRETELALFRVAQETITNIARHARADAVLIQCNAGESQFVIDIEDDGEGFDVAAVTTDPTSMRGLGLAGMRERASLVGGHIEIDSTPGAGARVVIAVPLAKEATPHV
jgi:signal transduction histidine kinase